MEQRRFCPDFIRVANFSFTMPIRVLTNAVKVFESGETGQEVENDLLSCMAPLSFESCNI
jgi:hypothetical protein